VKSASEVLKVSFIYSFRYVVHTGSVVFVSKVDILIFITQLLLVEKGKGLELV